MAYPLSNVSVSSDTFATWIEKTNLGLEVISKASLTAANTSTGNTTSGNAVLLGIFSSNTIVATNQVRGGNLSSSNTLYVTSEVDVSNTFINVINTSANVTLAGSGKFANVNIPLMATSNVNITSGSANVFINATNVDIRTTKVNVVSDFAVWNVAGTGTKILNVVSGSNTIAMNAESVNSVSNTISSNVTTSFAVNGGNTLITNSNTTIGNTTVAGVTVTTNSTSTAVTLAGNTLSVTANVVVTAANADIRNVTINAANTRLTGTGNLVISTSGANVSSNVFLTGANTTFDTSTTVNVNGNVFFTADMQQVVYANTNIGTNTSAAQNVYTFDKTSYGAAELTAVAKSLGGNTQIIKMLVAHDGGTNVHSTVYGTIAAPNTANVGVFSSEISGANVNIKFLQTAPNTSVKIVAHLIK